MYYYMFYFIKNVFIAIQNLAESAKSCAECNRRLQKWTTCNRFFRRHTVSGKTYWRGGMFGWWCKDFSTNRRPFILVCFVAAANARNPQMKQVWVSAEICLQPVYFGFYISGQLGNDFPHNKKTLIYFLDSPMYLFNYKGLLVLFILDTNNHAETSTWLISIWIQSTTKCI